MITDVERTRLQKLFSDTISLLCRSGLPGSCAHRVDALIGVTLDNQEVVLVNFSENFWHNNECPPEAEARTEITVEKDSDAWSSQMSEKCHTSSMCSYEVKDEHRTGASQDLYTGNASVLGSNGGYVTDITATNLHNNSHNPVEYMEQQNAESPNQNGSAIGSVLPEPETLSALESDSDCLLIKTELPEGDSQVNNMTAESKNLSTLCTDGITLSSLPSVQKSSYGGSSLRIKHIHSMQRRARWNPYGSKLYRPQQRYNTMQHSASNPSQVSYDDRLVIQPQVWNMPSALLHVIDIICTLDVCCTLV